MAHPIVRLLGTDPKRVVGLCAGASRPGIDAAIVEIRGSGKDLAARLLGFERFPFPPGLAEAVEGLLDPSLFTSAAELSTLNVRLGLAFAEAAAHVAGDEAIDLVGSHGLTVWHQPPWMKQRGDLIASTLQLGEPALIAARTGAVTIGDFRVADVAVAGAGAPLSPYVDWLLHRRTGAVRALVDIGPVSSVSVVGERLADGLAFDTGPGTLLLDALPAAGGGDAQGVGDEPAPAADGRVLPAVLARLLDDDFLRQPPPRTTGRERYGRGFARALAAREPGASALDLRATAVAFIAESIAHSLRTFVLPRGPVDEVLVSGAGADEPALMEHLRAALGGTPVRVFDEGGVTAAAREAVSFAVLAALALHGFAANVPAATGARRPAILGKLCLPPPD